MSYTDAEVEPLAQQLVHELPGFDIRLARVWIKSESGTGNNPLGVTHVENGVSKLSTYSSRAEGISAAVRLLKSSSNYSGVRTAIAGGNLRQQALALIASPWNHPGSPYYTKVFTAAGLLGGTATPPPTTGSSGGSTTLAGFLGVPASTVVTLDMVKQATAKLPKDFNYFGYYFDFIGQRAGDVPLTTGAGGVVPAGTLAGGETRSPDPVSAAGDAIGGVMGAVTGLVAYLAALVLFGLGVYLYSRGGDKSVAPTE